MLAPKLGARLPMVGGAFIAALGQILLSTASPDSTYLGSVLLPSILIGLGIGLLFVPATTVATAGVPEERSGLASGLVNTANQFGGALGVAALATLATVFATPAEGYTRAMFVAAGVVIVAGLVAFFVPRQLPAEPQQS